MKNWQITVLSGLVFLVVVCLSGCVGDNSTSLYENSTFDFSVIIPDDYQVNEIPQQGEEEGVQFRNKTGNISVRAMAAGIAYSKMSFEEYVRIAASVEIQNFNKLHSIKPFISDYGVKGYKTYWQVVEIISPDESKTKKVPDMKIIGPIFYFPPKQESFINTAPVKTIMISSFSEEKGSLVKESGKIAKSFRYLDQYKEFIWKNDDNSEVVVGKEKPFQIILPSNPTTGYDWHIEDLDSSCFELIKAGFTHPITPAVGVGGISWWMIKPVKSGVKKINLSYYRSWEGQVKAVEDFDVTLVIR